MPKRKVHLQSDTKRPATQPVTTITVLPAVMNVATELAQGDPGRIQLNTDGTATVYNSRESRDIHRNRQ